MELDQHFHKIQGVLKNEERNKGPLHTFKRGSEDKLDQLLASVKKITEKEDFNEKLKRKLYILLFANTDTEIFNDLKKTRKYAHLVGFFPKLSRDLFIFLVLELKMSLYLYESIEHFCSPLSYQVLEICCEALKWIDLFEAINIVENLLVALFSKIMSMDEEDKYNAHMKDIFQRLLLHFDAEKSGTMKRMGRWKASRLKHYAGLVMASLLSVLEKYTRIYCKQEDYFCTEYKNLYEVEMDRESVKLKSIESNHITDLQCYEHVVAKCLGNLSSVTIDLWMFWVEIDLDDIPGTDNTLQRFVGNCAYNCRAELQKAEGLGVVSREACDLISRLGNFALFSDPKVNEGETSFPDLDIILEKIQDPKEDTVKWIKILLYSPSFSVEPEILKVVEKYINSLQMKDFLKLLNHLFDFIKNEDNECSFQKEFILSVAQSLNTEYQEALSKCFIQYFGLTQILNTDEFHTVFVETFNKVINEEDKEKELYPTFLSLALQNPEQVVNKAVDEGITSEMRGNMMAEILGKLHVFCNATYPTGYTLLIKALETLLLKLPILSENQQTNFPLFVKELVMRKTLNGKQFVKSCLMTNLHRQIKIKNETVLTACLQTLSELFDVDCITNIPVCCLTLMQVVEAIRWTPPTFSLEASQICELALELISPLVNKWFETDFSERMRITFASLVRQEISSINRYHLFRLLKEEEMPTDPGMKLVYRMHYGIGEWSVLSLNPDERTELVYSLCFVVPRLTTSEFQEMFSVLAPKCSEFLALFHIVTDAILICIDSAKLNTEPTVMRCLCIMILDVAHCVLCEINRWTKNDNEYRISVLSKMCQVMANVPESEDQIYLGHTLYKLFQKLLPEGSRRKPLTDEEMNTVTAAIASIGVREVRKNLAKEFLEMVHR